MLVASLFIAAPAHAGIGACGNIDVEASAMCDVKTSGGCTAACQQLSFEASCSAQLEGGCQGMCNASASLSCTTDCSGTCMATCTGDPPSYDCSADCKADGDAMCSGQCASNANQSQCEGTCKAEFSAKCDASCMGTKGSVDCAAKCNARCSGSCDAQANVGCQISCTPPSAYATCESMLSGGCMVECTQPQGALFCNGNYVDTNGNLASCEAAIEALFPTIHVTTNGMASANCSGNTCEAEASGSATVGCAVAPGRSNEGMGGAAAMLVGLGAMLVGRRRQAR
ncbi:MAG TPA: hypothetical protein VGM29_01875 [Polyangiaceae bacterium]